jgi:hypothetical protein
LVDPKYSTTTDKWRLADGPPALVWSFLSVCCILLVLVARSHHMSAFRSAVCMVHWPRWLSHFDRKVARGGEVASVVDSFGHPCEVVVVRYRFRWIPRSASSLQ